MEEQSQFNDSMQKLMNDFDTISVGDCRERDHNSYNDNFKAKRNDGTTDRTEDQDDNRS